MEIFDVEVIQTAKHTSVTGCACMCGFSSGGGGGNGIYDLDLIEDDTEVAE